ncbi:hypothetical protein [Streptomyces sp. MZ04]|uniref:hypothetical protein n=1 Tax=Streptomyces sp. MZ04 TaxID=2559236 RepID=UPI00107E78AA|nr:hypothetical protein [Streptomyces sp. MZ04]TGB14619.1 hypothetical protein E2651_05110 [Streptomyces sp. MZ04]
MSIAATAACALLGAVGPQAVADPAPNSTEGQSVTPNIKVRDDGWIEYKPLLDKVGAEGTKFRAKGTRNAGGDCKVSRTSSASAGAKQATYTEEVAYNPAKCEFEFLAAKLTPEQLSTLRSLKKSAGGDEFKSSSDSKTKSAALDATYARHLKTSWIDPINITISSQDVGLEWTNSDWSRWAYKRDSFKGCIGGVCLDETYIVSGSDGLETLSDGWRKTANVHFRNDSFALWVVAIVGPAGWAACGFPTDNTADFHHQDKVTGFKSGASEWSWDDSKSGACTNLVHHGEQTGASYPF